MNRFLTLAVFLLALAAQGCGDSGSSPTTPSVASPTSTSTPPQQRSAVVSLTLYNVAYLIPGEFSTADVYFDFELRETAGTGFNVHRFHMDIFRPSGEHVERRTYNQEDINYLLGGGYINGNGTIRKALVYPARTSIARGSTGWFLRLTADYKDDTGRSGKAEDAVELQSWGL